MFVKHNQVHPESPEHAADYVAYVNGKCIPQEVLDRCDLYEQHPDLLAPRERKLWDYFKDRSKWVDIYFRQRMQGYFFNDLHPCKFHPRQLAACAEIMRRSPAVRPSRQEATAAAKSRAESRARAKRSRTDAAKNRSQATRRGASSAAGMLFF